MRDQTLRTMEIDGMNKLRQRELIYICRQYDEMKAQLEAVRGGFNNLRRDGQPRGTRTGNPTAAAAEKALRIRNRVDAIDAALGALDTGLRSPVRRNVTRGIPYERLNAPCGRNQFYAARRAFLLALDKNL